LSFSIILTSAKPYLDQVHFSYNFFFIHFYFINFFFWYLQMDPETRTQFLGLLIAAQPPRRRFDWLEFRIVFLWFYYFLKF
jgi:hypothetical protein